MRNVRVYIDFHNIVAPLEKKSLSPAFPDGHQGFFNTESVIKCQDAMLLSRFCVRDTEKENQFWLRQV